MDFENMKIRKTGMTIVMVETGGDTGHAPRATPMNLLVLNVGRSLDISSVCKGD
jgi:hypothetical protein